MRRSIDEGPDEWVLCAEYSQLGNALENLSRLGPDVVVLDVAHDRRRSGPADAFSFADFVGSGTRRSHVLLIGADDSEPLVEEALKAGVKGILSHSDVEDLLDSALEAVTRGKPFFSSAATEVMLDRFLHMRGGGAVRSRSRNRHLTRREREVVRLLADGHTTREVAASLNISVKTAENHRANAMSKLGVRQLSELVRQAIQEGILS